jgi:hypothetical protein
MRLGERIPNHEISGLSYTSSKRPTPNFAAITATQQVTALDEIVVFELAHKIAFEGAISIPTRNKPSISTGRLKTAIPLE